MVSSGYPLSGNNGAWRTAHTGMLGLRDTRKSARQRRCFAVRKKVAVRRCCAKAPRLCVHAVWRAQGREGDTGESPVQRRSEDMEWSGGDLYVCKPMQEHAECRESTHTHEQRVRA